MSIKMSHRLKGIAVILMVIHHSFAYPERINESIEYYSIVSDNLVYYLAVFGKICVAMFFIISGYGIAFSIANKPNWTPFKTLKNLYTRVFIIAALFFPLIILTNGKNDSIITITENLAGWSVTYNGEWWFLLPYVICIIFYYLYNRFFNYRYLFVLFYVLSFTLCVISVLFDSIIWNTHLFYNLKCFVIWYPAFLSGVLAFKKGVFEFRISKIFSFAIILCLIIFRGVLFPYYTFDFLIAIIFIGALIPLISNTNFITKMLEYCGKNSIYVWLIHTFLIYYLFQSLMYYIEIDILIVTFTISLSLLIGFFIEKIALFLLDNTRRKF